MRWISRPYVITLDQGIEHARESHSKPRERPKFSYTRDSENLEETVVKVRPLGHGQFGRVWLAFHAPTQRLVALKEVEAQTEKRRKRAVAEISANARQAAPFERRATPTDSHGSPEVSEDVAAWRRDLVAGAVHGCDQKQSAAI